MTAVLDLQNFGFQGQLVRVIMRAGDPWFVAADVCAVLDIKNARDAIADFDEDEKGVATSYTLGGDQAVLVVSEAGLYRLIFQSRKPVAKTFQRWVLHEVLPSIRKTGKYALDEPAPSPQRMTEDDLRAAPLLHRLQCIREIRSIRGRQVAAVMWNRLGLPALPPPPPTAMDEARQCLRHLLDFMLPSGSMVRAALQLALDEDEETRLLLLAIGVRVMPDQDAFLVANRHPGLDHVFKGTEWGTPAGHVQVLRRLPGVQAGVQSRYGCAVQRRGTLMPSQLMDEAS